MLAFVVAALQVSDKIKTLGAYAGFASVVGIGVLSVLYFGQARELKRLREWAGRAPERAAEMQERIASDAATRVTPAPRTVVAQPGRPAAATPVTPAAAAASAAIPASAALAGATGAAPAAPAVPGAPAVAPSGNVSPATPVAGAADPAKPAAPVAPAAATPAAPKPPAAPPAATPPAGDATQVIAPVPAVPGTPATPAPAERPAPAVPLRSTPPSRPAPRRVTAPPAAPPAHEQSPARATLTVVGGVVAAAALIALLVTQVFAGGDGGGGSSTSTPATVAKTTTTTTEAQSTTTTTPALKPIERGAISYAVLNATLTNQLARSVGDKLQASGYTKQVKIQQAKQVGKKVTIVAYAPSQKRAALQIADVLGVSPANVVPVANDPTAAGEGAGADVVVVMGADKAQA